MCVAGLNVTTQPCEHRWYNLVRACHPANNLANCPEKLKLEGWESRVDSCPFCNSNDKDVHESTHRLFGSTSSASSTTSSPTSPIIEGTRPRRSGSDSTMSPLSRMSSGTSVDSDGGRRNREMNERLELYLRSHPHEVLPSALKNYPTYPQSSPSDENTSSDAAPVPRRAGTGPSKGWKKNIRLGLNMGMFKG